MLTLYRGGTGWIYRAPPGPKALLLLMTRDDSSSSAAGLRQLPPVNGLSMASFQSPRHVIYIVSDLQEPAFHDVAQSLLESRVAAVWDFFTHAGN